METKAILVIGTHHIHAAVIIDGAAHIAWSGRVPCPPTSGRYGLCADPQSINGDEPWIEAARQVIDSIRSTHELADCELRPRLEAAGVPLV
jgi:hypothetical protein